MDDKITIVPRNRNYTIIVFFLDLYGFIIFSSNNHRCFQSRVFFSSNISHPEHTPSVLKVIPKGCRFEYKQRLQI